MSTKNFAKIHKLVFLEISCLQKVLIATDTQTHGQNRVHSQPSAAANKITVI